MGSWRICRVIQTSGLRCDVGWRWGLYFDYLRCIIVSEAAFDFCYLARENKKMASVFGWTWEGGG